MLHTKSKSTVPDLLKDKIQLITTNDSSIYLVGPIQLPVNLYGETVLFQWYSWIKGCEVAGDFADVIKQLSSANLADYQQSSVLVHGDFEHADDALIRMHSICHTGDIFGSKRCDCGFQLKDAMKKIADNGAGALFYLANHEGRGIGLFSKAMAYVLQENGYDTVEANEGLGFEDDTRNYEDAIYVLKRLRTKPVTLLTNNPKKIEAMLNAGLTITGREAIWGDQSTYNEKYLQTKVQRSGHLAEEDNSKNDK